MSTYNQHDETDIFEEELNRTFEKQALIMDVMERRNQIQKIERPEIQETESVALEEYIKQKKLKDIQIDQEMATRQKRQIQEIEEERKEKIKRKEEKQAHNREITRKKKIYWLSLTPEEKKKLIFNIKKEQCIKKIKKVIHILFNLSIAVILILFFSFTAFIFDKIFGKF